MEGGEDHGDPGHAGHAAAAAAAHGAEVEYLVGASPGQTDRHRGTAGRGGAGRRLRALRHSGCFGYCDRAVANTDGQLAGPGQQLQDILVVSRG